MTSVQDRDQAVAGLLAQAVQRLNADDPAGADGCLDRALAMDGAQPVALYLKGVAHFARGEWAAADPLFHRALQSSPGQSRVAGHLAKAALNWAAALSGEGRNAQAAEVLQRALARVQGIEGLEAATAALHQALGLAQKALRRYDDALASLDRAEALASLDWAWAAGLSPGRRELRVCRSMALQHLRRFDEAAEALRSILADNPLDMDTHIQLNELFYRQGQDDRFLASYDEAARAVPDSPLPHTAKGHLLLKAGRADEAHDAYGRALQIAPDDPAALAGRGRALEALGQLEEALALHDRGVRSHPEDCAVLVDAASAWLRAGDAKAALALASRAHAAAAADQAALAILGLCYRALDDAREYDLNGYDALVQAYDLEPPEGYDDMATFNRDLARYLDALHQDRRANFTQTLRGGTRLYDEAFNNGHVLVDRLKRVIDAAVARYAASLPAGEDHPFTARRTRSFAYTGSWSSRMCDQGFHLNHIHTQGWISSAYYVAVPDAVAASSAGDRQGWLTFGAPTADFGPAFTPRRAIQPQVGRLVLFPSYLWHGVTPFSSPQTRTTIAFDVAPV